MSDKPLAQASPPFSVVQSHEKRSPSIVEFSKAFALAQGEFPTIPKDSRVEVKSKEGKFLYAYMYADLTTILNCTRPALAKHGISVTQGVVAGGFATTLFHSSGEFVQSGFIPCDIPKNVDMKQVAAMITYVKRISITAALGVSADEDVDAAANEASKGNTTQKQNAKQNQNQRPQAQSKTPPGPTQPMLKRLYAIGKESGWESDAIRVYSLGRVKKTPGELSKAQYDQLIKFLQENVYDQEQANQVDAYYAGFSEDEMKKFESGGGA